MRPKIAVVGGSLREQIVVDSLRKKGFFVSSFATEKPCHKDAPSIEKCLNGASALILPVRSNREDGMIEGTSHLCPVAVTEALLDSMAKNAMIYCGKASNELCRIARKTGHPLKEIMSCDSVAIPNAVLTAEGTLAYIMEHSSVSLKETQIAIFGYGRVGKACADVFQSVGCKVVVFCRSEDDFCRGREHGHDMRYYSGISAILPKIQYLVNTVPALVVDEKSISYMNPDGMILDLASLPGGVDTEAAETHKITSVMLHGIPGKYAPHSAGKILASYYIEELKPLLGGDRCCD